MDWAEIEASCPLAMGTVLEFMARWQPDSIRSVRAASAEAIAEYAEPHGGSEKLPDVYVDFLSTMGEDCGALAPNFRSFALSELLKDRSEEKEAVPEPSRYVKVSVGEEDYNGRHPDDFLDLEAPQCDGADAGMIRILEADLVNGLVEPEVPFPSFSDMIRRLAVAQVAFNVSPRRRPLSFGFGADLDSAQRAYEFVVRLGFAVSDLGASTAVVTLEDPARGAIGLLIPANDRRPSTTLRYRAREETQEKLIQQLLAENQQALSGL